MFCEPNCQNQECVSVDIEIKKFWKPSWYGASQIVSHILRMMETNQNGLCIIVWRCSYCTETIEYTLDPAYNK